MQIAAEFNDYDLVILISPNAVTQGMIWLDEVGLKERLGNKPIAVVGPASALALSTYGIRDVIFPKDSTGSEALLAMSEITRLSGKKVLIVKGEGGNEDLSRRLLQQGNQVSDAEVYRRVCPRWPDSITLEAISVANSVICGSQQGLNNLYAMVTQERGLDWLNQTFLLLPSRAALEESLRRQHQGKKHLLADMQDDTILDILLDEYR